MTLIELDNFIALKDTIKRLVTGPVAIPECPDCDFDRGEKTFTVDEIETMVHKYNTEYRNADQMHIINSTKDIIGQSVENWTLKEPMSVKNINGTIVKLPIGTWMTTIKIKDDATWDKIESGELRGFSAMYVPESEAEIFKAQKRTLVAELENPVPVSIAVVDKPCVFDAIFTSVKAGRSISNNNFSKIQSAFDNLKDLLTSAMNERTHNPGDDDMDEEKLKEIVGEAIKAEIDPLKEEIEALKNAEPEPVPEPTPEPEPPADPEPEPEPSELEALKTQIEDLKQQVNKSNDLSNDPTNTSVTKSFNEQAGLDARGCPIK